MKLNEGRNRNIALVRYGKKAKLLLGNGVPEDYILTACKFCVDVANAANIAIMIKRWLKYAPEEIRDTIHSLTFEEWSGKLAEVIENRKVPHCFMQIGSWKVGEFDDSEDCQLFPVPNNWCICKDPKWIDAYHSKDSRLLIIYNPQISGNFKYMVAELEHNGLITFWDIENSSTDFQKFPEYTSILPKQIKDYLFKVSLSNNPYKAYNKMMESKIYKNMKKNVKRINESQLRAIVAESVKRVLKESAEDNWGLDITYYGGTSISEPQGSGSYEDMLQLAQQKIESEPDIRDIRIYKVEGGDSEGWGAQSTTVNTIKGQNKDVGGFKDPHFRDWYRKEYASQN